jgi:cystathionine beta-lyase/cystathionine gamma-synthase
MAGAVIAKESLIQALHSDFTVLGGVLDPHAAFLLQRGLKTYFVRYRAQSATAQRVAEFLASHPAVERVGYPGLPGDPGHALARAQKSEFGALGSCTLRGGAENLRLFAMAASLGSTESLVLPPQMLRGRDLTEEQQRISGVGAGSVRLSIGLEDEEDLLEDVAQALAAAQT